MFEFLYHCNNPDLTRSYILFGYVILSVYLCIHSDSKVIVYSHESIFILYFLTDSYHVFNLLNMLLWDKTPSLFKRGILQL